MTNDTILSQLARIYEPSIIESVESAMAEVGALTPTWHDECEAYVVQCDLYPEEASGDSEEDALFTYWAYIANMFQAIEQNNYSEIEHKKITAKTGRWGGSREGAGRPKGRGVRVTIPADIAQWLQADASHLDKVRKLMG